MHTPLAIASETRESPPAYQAILPWLDMLRQLYPPTALLLVGAGNGSSPWVQYLMATGHRNVTLVEADETTANRLKIATKEHPDWIVESHVIASHSAPTAFYTASLQTESGLLEPESLRSLWRNLNTTHKQTRQAIALVELQENAETPANWLMVDCLPALPIIQGAAQQLASFDVIALRVVLNENAPPASAPGTASVDELQSALQALGFRCLAIETSRHPAIGHALFARDTAAQALELTQAKEHALVELKAKEQALAQVQVLQQEKAEQTQLLQILAKLEKQGQEVEKRVREDLNTGLANAVKQLEAFLGIQNWFQSSGVMLDFHGWPISPDLGILLLERMLEEQYDLIIEFGSGTSTALFAQGVEVLSKQATGRAQVPSTARNMRPKTEIVTFEHDSQYHAKTLKMLRARGLDHLVRLVHAPLVEWCDRDQTYRYYDCKATLDELARQHAHRQLNILLLVDGPPGSTCPNARYPAVPFLFTALGSHQIDVVLDDADRPEEKKVIELWRGFWKERSIGMSESVIQSEKGIYLAHPRSTS